MTDDEFKYLLLDSAPTEESRLNHIKNNHIQKSTSELINRMLSNHKIQGSSAFINSDEKTVIKNIREALSKEIYQNAFDEWRNEIISGNANSLKLTLDIDNESIVGKCINYKKHKNKKSSVTLKETNYFRCVFAYDPTKRNIFIVTAFPKVELETNLAQPERQRELDLNLNAALDETKTYQQALDDKNIAKILQLRASASGSEFNLEYEETEKQNIVHFYMHDNVRISAEQDKGKTNEIGLRHEYRVDNPDGTKSPWHSVDMICFNAFLNRYALDLVPSQDEEELRKMYIALNSAVKTIYFEIQSCMDAFNVHIDTTYPFHNNDLPRPMPTIGVQSWPQYAIEEQKQFDDFEF